MSGNGGSSACDGLLKTEHMDCSPPGLRCGMGGGTVPFIAMVGGFGGGRCTIGGGCEGLIKALGVSGSRGAGICRTGGRMGGSISGFLFLAALVTELSEVTSGRGKIRSISIW